MLFAKTNSSMILMPVRILPAIHIHTADQGYYNTVIYTPRGKIYAPPGCVTTAGDRSAPGKIGAGTVSA